MSNFLAERQFQRETMDDPNIDEARFAGALRGLRRVNFFTRASAIVWPAIKDTAERCDDDTFCVLDVGCGGGDTAIALSRRLRRAGYNARVNGCDLSPLAVEYARESAGNAGCDAEFFEHDVLAGPLPGNYHVILCSLFLHHLSENDAVTFLKSAASATRDCVIVHDLLRSRAGWWLAYSGVRLLLCNDVCREDGPRSVECAFTIDEARNLAARAALDGASVEARFPFRYLLHWSKAQS